MKTGILIIIAWFAACVGGSLVAEQMKNDIPQNTPEDIPYVPDVPPRLEPFNWPQPKIRWIGFPVFNTADKYEPSDFYPEGIEFGLRSDGVVVWRKK